MGQSGDSDRADDATELLVRFQIAMCIRIPLKWKRFYDHAIYAT
jgi:hypothetical protein